MARADTAWCGAAGGVIRQPIAAAPTGWDVHLRRDLIISACAWRSPYKIALGGQQ